MDVSAVNRTQSATVQPMTGKLGVIVAQRSIEAARQNQAVGSAGNPEKRVADLSSIPIWGITSIYTFSHAVSVI